MMTAIEVFEEHVLLLVMKYIFVLVVKNLINIKNIKNGYNLEEEKVTYALLKDDDDGL